MKAASIIITLFAALSSGITMQAQQPAFSHLSTAEGLSDNNVNWAARDKNGILWIATTEGLNSFDGNRITTYYKQQYPQLTDNNIIRILIDNENRVWIRTAGHYLTMLDERRQFHKVPVGDTTDSTGITSFFLTQQHGLIVLKGATHFLQQKGNPVQFEKASYPFQEKLKGGISFSYFLANDMGVYYKNSRLIVIDYKTMKLVLEHPFPGLTAANYIANDELLLFTTKADVFYRFSISQKKTVKEYRNITDQHNAPITGDLRNVTRIDSNRFAFTTFFAGLYILDIQTNKVQHWVHDPLDMRSIGGNNTLYLRYDTSGYLFVTTQTSGLHYYKLNEKPLSSRLYFMDADKQVFDGYIQSLAAGKENILWMGAQDRLIRWDKKNDKTAFIPVRLADGTDIMGRETIRETDIDENGDLWVGSSRYGVFVFDSQLKKIMQFTDSMPGNKPGLPSNHVNAMCRDNAGNWWVGTIRGVCLISATNHTVQLFNDHPQLAAVSKLNCTELWKDEKGNMWIGSTRGAWYYDFEKKLLRNYSTKEGLPHNTVYAVNNDNNGNTYFATLGGLAVLSPNGNIQNYTRSNGLRNDRCEEILKDKKGYLWIGNLNCIIRFDPSSKTFTVFEDGIGFSHGGYRIRCGIINAEGEMFWGTDKGVIYFYPEQVSNTTHTITPFIHSMQAGPNTYYFTRNERIRLPYNTSSFVFSFSSGELTGDTKNQFQYRLAGIDNDWVNPIHTGQAIYSKLPPGHYKFHVRASADGINWHEAAYTADLIIEQPWWKQTWFRILCIALATGMIGFVYIHFQRRRKNKMAMLLLNTKMAETKFLNLRLQMNPHFLFNSLSAIQHLIVSGQTNKAYKYLTVFSNLLRSLLNFAEKNFIPLEDEIRMLNMYTELESLRFDETFTWNITMDETLTAEEVFVPSLMVQPFAENAIWHGLLHKEGKKELTIRFSAATDDFLSCIIEDNGIGREKAGQIKESNISARMRESKGISIIRERLDLLQQKTGKPANLEITDLYDIHDRPAGTRVKITIPYYNPEGL